MTFMDATDVVRVTGDRILVRPIVKRLETESGLILPSTILDEPETSGVVVALGHGPVTSKGVPLDHFVGVGDTILFSPTVGQEVEMLGERFIMMKEADVLAVIEQETE